MRVSLVVYVYIYIYMCAYIYLCTYLCSKFLFVGLDMFWGPGNALEAWSPSKPENPPTLGCSPLHYQPPS